MKRDMREIKESIYFLNHLFYFSLLAFNLVYQNSPEITLKLTCLIN